jgi:hypothetical protein
MAAAVYAESDAILPPITTTNVYGTFHPAAPPSATSQSLLTPRANQSPWKASLPRSSESTPRERKHFSLPFSMPWSTPVLGKLSENLAHFKSILSWTRRFSKKDDPKLPTVCCLFLVRRSRDVDVSYSGP